MTKKNALAAGVRFFLKKVCLQPKNERKSSTETRTDVTAVCFSP